MSEAIEIKCYPNDFIGNEEERIDPTVPEIERQNGGLIFAHALTTPIPARLWDEFFSNLRVQKVVKGARETDDKSNAVAVRIYDKYFVPIRGYKEGMKPTVRQKAGVVLSLWSLGKIAVKNPEAVFIEGSVVEIEVVIEGLCEALIKLKAPTEKQQVQFEGLRSKQKVTPKGEVFGAGYIIGAYTIARELFLGAEGFMNNTLDAIPVELMHRALVVTNQAGDDTDLDMGN